LRKNAAVEDAHLRTLRGLDRGLFQSLTTCGWIRDSHHVLIREGNWCRQILAGVRSRPQGVP
jgi:hypothetical protein